MVRDPIEITRDMICPSIADQYTLLNRASHELPILEGMSDRHSLFKLIRDRPDLYQKMIGAIALGATYTVAAECIGIRMQTLSAWLRKGNSYLTFDEWGEELVTIDNYFTRLVFDVRRAVAYGRQEAEIIVKEQDPKTWLKSKIASSLGNEWRDPPALRQQIEHINRTENNPLIPSQEEEVEYTSEDLGLEIKMEPQALLELADANVIQMDDTNRKIFEGKQKEIEQDSNDESTDTDTTD